MDRLTFEERFNKYDRANIIADMDWWHASQGSRNTVTGRRRTVLRFIDRFSGYLHSGDADYVAYVLAFVKSHQADWAKPFLPDDHPIHAEVARQIARYERDRLEDTKHVEAPIHNLPTTFYLDTEGYLTGHSRTGDDSTYRVPADYFIIGWNAHKATVHP